MDFIHRIMVLLAQRGDFNVTTADIEWTVEEIKKINPDAHDYDILEYLVDFMNLTDEEIATLKEEIK